MTKSSVSTDKLLAQREKLAAGKVEEIDTGIVTAAIDTLLEIGARLEEKDLTIVKLKRMLFGSKTESTRTSSSGAKPNKARGPRNKDRNRTDKGKRKSRGRLSVDDYPAADKVDVPHPHLKKGCRCPKCERGRLYCLNPARVLHLVGGPPVRATCYHLEHLRCSACQAVFTAPEPEEMSGGKYDPSAKSMVCLLKYGVGLPLYRQDKLQDWLGIPMPASTQFDLIESVVEAGTPAYNTLLGLGANASLCHIDDTGVQILDLKQQIKEEKSDRTGLHTTCVVAMHEDREIRLFFSGRNHAGENLGDLLDQRTLDSSPIIMADALSVNFTHGHKTLDANCLAHGRRQFYDQEDVFPKLVDYVLVKIGAVYANEAHTKEMGMTAQARLAYHQKHSAFHMERLHHWFQALFEERLVEPNSVFGKAVKYMLKHWDRLTLFLRVADVPLDNNICERAIKPFVMLRKNSLFYKTSFGAFAGDVLLSLIHTCVGIGENPFDYLNALQIHQKAVASTPNQWLPWNFRTNLQAAAEPKTTSVA